MIGAGAGPPLPAGRSQADIVLSARGVSKRYRPRSAHGQIVVANDGLDLTVHRGEIVALLGPNGAGKSTFLRQVAGQLLPSSGEIAVGGVDMVARPELAKRHLSVIPQECEPLSNLTAEEHVRYFSRIKSSNTRLSDERVEGILTTVGLLGQRKKLVRELSGGYKRRVLIAVALAGDSPDLLLLDEPTTGLDPEARRSVWNVIELLKTEGRGVLLTTHYIEEAEVLADQIVIINDGRFVARGSVDETCTGWVPGGGWTSAIRIGSDPTDRRRSGPSRESGRSCSNERTTSGSRSPIRSRPRRSRSSSGSPSSGLGLPLSLVARGCLPSDRRKGDRERDMKRFLRQLRDATIMSLRQVMRELGLLIAFGIVFPLGFLFFLGQIVRHDLLIQVVAGSIMLEMGLVNINVIAQSIGGDKQTKSLPISGSRSR